MPNCFTCKTISENRRLHSRIIALENGDEIKGLNETIRNLEAQLNGIKAGIKAETVQPMQPKNTTGLGTVAKLIAFLESANYVGIIAIWTNSLNINRFNLLVSYFDCLFVFVLINFTVYDQPSFCFRVGNIVHYCLDIKQWFPSPVFTDIAKQSMLNFVPL